MPTRLHALADREFRREVETPAPKPTSRVFKGLNLNLAKFGPDWDHKRGSAARMAGIVLREDAQALRARVCADDKATRTYDQAADWLQAEARYLRKMASMQETAAARLNTVLAHCREEREVPATQ